MRGLDLSRLRRLRPPRFSSLKYRYIPVSGYPNTTIQQASNPRLQVTNTKPNQVDSVSPLFPHRVVTLYTPKANTVLPVMYSHLRPAARKFTTQLFQSRRAATRSITTTTTTTYQNRTQISTSTSTNLKRVAVPVPLTVTPIASHKRLIHTSRARSEMDTTSNATTKADPAPAASSTSPVPGSTSPMNTVTDAPESTTAPTVEVEEEATSTDPTLSRPTQYAPEITDDSDPLADPLSVESQKLQNNNNPLPLPSPETATHVPPEEQPKVVTVNGQAVALDNLGPMVVHKDGTISRIANWHEMTDIEQESTLRILGKRNQLRLTNLREGRVNGEGM